MVEAEYNRLLSFAKFYVRNKPHLIADDIINDVLLQIFDEGKEFDLADAEKMVKNHPDIRAKTIATMGKEFAHNETEKVCKDCKELLPVACFYIHNQKAMQVLSSYCKPCYAKRTAIRQKTDEGKKNNRLRQKRWREKHPEKWAMIHSAQYAKRKKAA